MSTSNQLISFLPSPGSSITGDELLSRFLAYAESKGLNLYAAQEEAILELYSGKHVILGTPTGSGKSLVAEALHFKGLAEGKVSYYTCPIKALVNEKFFALCETFGAENVGMMTGDAAVNREAPIICCTAEILMNLTLREEGSGIDYVIMDEFHYYADKERGVAWQIPLLSLPFSTFLLMSATLGPTNYIEEKIKSLTRREIAVVTGLERPVPLEFEYSEVPLHETIAHLVEKEQAPIYLVNFTQRSAAEQAQALTCVNLCNKQEKEAIRIAMQGVKFDTPYGKDMQRFLRAGIGLHHAGIMPKYRRLTERLAQKGMLKVISGTDTLGMGINIPIRTVLFTQLCKFDGHKMGILKSRDFHQIAGRAGRKGYDDHGLVVAQAPEHVIENIRLTAKAAGGKKIQKKQAPQKGYVHWDKNTFERLREKQPEPLESRFTITHGMLINLLQADELWPRGGYGRLVELIARSHESEHAKRNHRRRAAQLFQSLLQSEIVQTYRYSQGRGSYVEVSQDLQQEFSLFHSLSLYLVEAIEALDRESETYGLDLLSMAEAILEDPTIVLLRQVDKLKQEKLAELKAQGVPYEDRIAELEKIEHVKPNAEFIWGTFAAFAQKHPWLGSADLRPKSVARDIFERLSSFQDYVVEYGLQRSEGVLLRYLSDAYRVLANTIPESARDDIVEDILTHLKEMVRNVDSSLLDEWERMRGGQSETKWEDAAAQFSTEEEKSASSSVELERLIQNPKAFASRVRNELHQLLRALAGKKYEEALQYIRHLEGEPEWTVESLEQAMAPYWEEHAFIDLKPRSRLPHNTLIREQGNRCWEVIQKIVDPEGETDWMLDCIVDFNNSLPEAAWITLRRIGI